MKKQRNKHECPLFESKEMTWEALSKDAQKAIVDRLADLLVARVDAQDVSGKECVNDERQD